LAAVGVALLAQSDLTLKTGRDDDLIRIVKTAPARGLVGIIRETMCSGVTLRGQVFAPEEVDSVTLPCRISASNCETLWGCYIAAAV
jgi:hypothetical protein